MKRFFLCFLAAMLFGCGAALAQGIDLPTAKRLGLVGEQYNGLIGAVAEPVDPAVQSFVDYINQGRLKHYRELSEASGRPLSMIQANAGKNLVLITSPGDYFKDQNGRWVKRD